MKTSSSPATPSSSLILVVRLLGCRIGAMAPLTTRFLHGLDELGMFVLPWCGRTNLNYTDSSTRVLTEGLPRTSNGIKPLVCRVTSR
jgi:hypothetical protein